MSGGMLPPSLRSPAISTWSEYRRKRPADLPLRSKTASGVTARSRLAAAPRNRGNAISIEYHGNRLREFETDNPDYGGICMEENSGNYVAQLDFCDASNHYQWFQWQDANL
jgi:hypothetical protein